MKKLLAYFVSIMIAAGAPVAQSAERVQGRHKAHSGTAVHKAKRPVKRAKSSIRAHHRHIVSASAETAVQPSHSLAQVPMQVEYGIAQSSDLRLQSAAALVLDQQTGEALYAKNPDVATPIA